MNTFLRARTACDFEYLISFRAEHSNADRDIKEIEGLLFRNWLNQGEKIISKIQSWRNKWIRFVKFSPKLAELVGRKLEMAPNRMFQQLTHKKKKKHVFYEAVDAHARRRLIITITIDWFLFLLLQVISQITQINTAMQ